MRFFSLIIPAALASLAFANPMEVERSLEARSKIASKCVSYHTADKLVHDYIKLRTPGLSLYEKQALANHILADNYADRSQSVDWLTNAEFGTSNTKAEFIGGLQFVPPVPSIDTMDVFHLCTKVLWRWRFNLLPLPVRGMNVFEVNPATKQIETNYVEFNSAVWMYDLGYTGCKPNATSYGKPSSSNSTGKA